MKKIIFAEEPIAARLTSSDASDRDTGNCTEGNQYLLVATHSYNLRFLCLRDLHIGIPNSGAFAITRVKRQPPHHHRFITP